jgi:hypothetical protein
MARAAAAGVGFMLSPFSGQDRLTKQAKQADDRYYQSPACAGRFVSS